MITLTPEFKLWNSGKAFVYQQVLDFTGTNKDYVLNTVGNYQVKTIQILGLVVDNLLGTDGVVVTINGIHQYCSPYSQINLAIPPDATQIFIYGPSLSCQIIAYNGDYQWTTNPFNYSASTANALVGAVSQIAVNQYQILNPASVGRYAAFVGLGTSFPVLLTLVTCPPGQQIVTRSIKVIKSAMFNNLVNFSYVTIITVFQAGMGGSPFIVVPVGVPPSTVPIDASYYRNEIVYENDQLNIPTSLNTDLQVQCSSDWNGNGKNIYVLWDGYFK